MAQPSQGAAQRAKLEIKTSRRTLLKRAAALGVAAPGVMALLAACGGDDDDAPAATATSASGQGQTPSTSGASSPATQATAAATQQATAGSGQSSGDQEPIVVAQAAQINYLDPNIQGTGVQTNLHNLTHDQLLAYDDSFNIIPHLAESWEIVDPTHYRFTIREGVKFHDGSELTAADVVFSLTRCYAAPDTMVRIEFCFAETIFEEVTAPDATTVEMTLKAPFAPFLNQLTYEWFIVPEEVVRSEGADNYNQTAVGSGPYKIVEWVQDQYVAMEAFDDYFLGAPNVKAITMRAIQEDATRIAALQRGEVDLITNVPPDSIELINSSEGARVETTQVDRIVFMIMNTKKAPFDNVLVRQAVNHAIDWDTIIETVMGGEAYRTPAPITQFDFPYSEMEDIVESMAYQYDPERAIQLLEEAGFPDGFDLNLEGPNGRWTKDAEALQAVAGYLNEVGIRTEATPQEWAYYYEQRFRTYEIAAGMFSFGNPIYDFDWLMAVYMDPDRSSQQFFIDPKLTDLAHRGVQTPDPDERVEIYREALTFIMEQAPWACGFGLVSGYGVSDRLQWKPRQGDEKIRLYTASMSG